MALQTYETFTRDQVTDAMLDDAAKLFSENYGVWGEHSGRLGKSFFPFFLFFTREF